MAELTPFGVALRKLRIDKNLRLLDLAERMDQSVSYISAVETGRKPIPDRFVFLLSRAMELSAQEIRDLRSAADRTRKEVDVSAVSVENRELIAEFARRIDEIPPSILDLVRKKVMKSIEGEVPFHRKRRGLTVTPMSTLAIREIADRVRSIFVGDDQVKFPIIDVLEYSLDKVLPRFFLDIRSQEEMGADEGRVIPGYNGLILREDVYKGACRGESRPRFTACHELGHYIIHREISFARTCVDTDKIYCDAEWQADTFAGSLLISRRHLHLFKNEDDTASACGVSNSAARVMLSKYRSEGYIS